MGNEITYNFWLVDELPHGASILVVDDAVRSPGGEVVSEVHVYFSLACSRQTVAADATRAFTRLGRCGDYKRVGLGVDVRPGALA